MRCGLCSYAETLSAAHRGVLFLDELPAFGSSLIEVLRQPLEGNPREVAISRAMQTLPGTIIFPANFSAVTRPSSPCKTPASATATATPRIPAATP